MKSDRMFGILCILLERENVTVRELAGYFEVSTRTIHRDLLDLSASGFPVVTRQGVGGGVSLLPNFRYNKSALSEDDMKVILAGIEGLATIDDSARMKTLLAKLRFSDGNRLLLENDIILESEQLFPIQDRDAAESDRRAFYRGNGLLQPQRHGDETCRAV